MVDQYYIDACGGGGLPGGGAIFRINIDGHFEQLVNGEWVAPEGEYELPPIDPRSEPTDEEKRCLASANAVNVLALLYEEAIDIFNMHVSTAEGLLLFAEAIGTIIALALGAIALSVLTIAVIIFGEFLAFVDFIGEDVWTSDFTNLLRCIFYKCSSVDGAGVVTFDVNCIWQELQDETQFQPNTAEIRLLGQIGYLLSIIGVDGLNLAGATTNITDAYCENCDGCITYSDPMLSTLGPLTAITRWLEYLNEAAPDGTYQATGGNVSTQGWILHNTRDSARFIGVVIDLGFNCAISGISFYTRRSTTAFTYRTIVRIYNNAQVQVYNNASGYGGSPANTWQINARTGAPIATGRYIVLGLDGGTAGAGATMGLCQITIES